MNKPKMYTKVNNFQRGEAEYVMKNYFPLLRWQSHRQHAILDIGCGAGDVTHDLMLAQVPISCERFDAIDKSKIMIDYAQLNYRHPKLSFYQLDITTNNLNDYIAVHGKYDHIISFFCLNWILKQQKTMENIYNLMNPNSDCLFLFVRDVVLYDAYEELSLDPQWSKYMYDVDAYISPYRYLTGSPSEAFGNLLTDIGFTYYRIDIKKSEFIFNDYESFLEFLRAVNPFLDRVPSELQEEFLIKHIEVIHSKNITTDGTYIFSYENMIVYAEN